MKRFCLAIAISLIVTSVYAGQTEDMNLCADRINNKYNINVKRTYFDMASECNNGEHGVHFLGFNYQQGFQSKSYGCLLNRKENTVIVEEIYSHQMKKYSGNECLGMMDIVTAIVMNNAFNKEATAIDKNVVKKRKAQEKKKEQKQHQELIKKCKAQYANNEYFEPYNKPKQLSNQVGVVVGWIVGEIREHEELIFFTTERRYVICQLFKVVYNNEKPEDVKDAISINKAAADERFKRNQYIEVGHQQGWLD